MVDPIDARGVQQVLREAGLAGEVASGPEPARAIADLVDRGELDAAALDRVASLASRWPDAVAWIVAEVDRARLAIERTVLDAEAETRAIRPSRSPWGKDRIGSYRILHPLGAGGMGQVYLVEDPELRRRLALKVLGTGRLATPEQIARFRREARAAARLRHTNIVAIHGFDVDRGVAYYTMDYVAGRTLADRIAEGPLEVEEALELLIPIAEAVEYAHATGILHRDLKPSNVLLSPDGEPRLTDFGLARAFGEEESGRLTVSGAVLGTPAYMSPEQAAGRPEDVDVRSDVYGLGAVLYEMLTGKVPFPGETPLAILHRILNEEVVPPARLRPGLPREIEAICLKAMARLPTERYGSARELGDDLRRHAEGIETRARPLSPLGRLVRSVRRHRATWAGAALLVLLNVFYVAWLHRALSESRDLNRRLEARIRQDEARTIATEASREGRPEVADSLFREALARATDRFEILCLQARYHQRHGRYDLAIASFEEAERVGREIGARPGLVALALFDLYWCHLARQPVFPVRESPEMLAILERIRREDPDNPLALLADSRLAAEPEVAGRLLDEAIASSDRPFWQALALRGIRRSEAGQMEGAEADLTAALAEAGDVPMLLAYHGAILLYRIRPADACRSFDRGLAATPEGDPIRPFFLVCRGLAETLIDRHDEARADLVAAGAHPALIASYLDYLATRHAQVLTLAAPLLDFKIAKFPDRAYLRGIRGVFRVLMCRHETIDVRRRVLPQALAELERAAEADPELHGILDGYIETAHRALGR